MFQLTTVVALLVGSCLAETFNENNVNDFNVAQDIYDIKEFGETKELQEHKPFGEVAEFDKSQQNAERQENAERQQNAESQGFDESQDRLQDKSQEFDKRQEIDESQFGNSQELDETHEEFDESQGRGDSQEIDESNGFREIDTTYEDKAVDRHVRYLDASREVLLEFAKNLRKGKDVTNAFLKVIDSFEKQIADFQAALGRRRVKPDLVEKLKKFIEEAAKDRKANTDILRTLTAKGLFLTQITEEKSREKRDNILKGAMAFLESIKNIIGDKAFDESLAVSGLVTLIFVIDDTGSMGAEIKAATAIATQIVRQNRDFDVDYILSPFNDPGTGPITYKDETQGEEFVKVLESLYAYGGGDCPELAFKGMLDALNASPAHGSPMYVFTDASPKDATAVNVENVRERALDLYVQINFFTKGDCGNSTAQAAYVSVASVTGGQVYSLKNTLEIENLGKLVSAGLGGSVRIGSGGSGPAIGRKRAAGSKYTISVDDSVEKLLITVTTQNSGTGITLFDPKGKRVTAGLVALTKGMTYGISSPVPGVYTLVVPVSAGRHKYNVNAVSGTNIDFGHYYVYIPKRGRNRVSIPIEQPLKGVSATLFLTVAGAESVTPSSLSIKVVNKDGRVHASRALRPVGTSGVRYFAKFVAPSNAAFKLQLYGRTRKGNQFVRTSAREDKAAEVILRLSYKPDSNVLLRGETTTLVIQIQRGNVGYRVETYAVSVKCSRMIGRVVGLTRNIRRGRIGFAWIAIAVPADAPKGKPERIEVLLTKKRETKPKATLRFSWLIV